MRSDRGDIITGYLVRLVGGLAVAGLLVIEGAAVTINRIGLEEAVQRAARQGAATYVEQRSVDAVERAAEQRLQRADAELVGVEVDRDAVSVTGTRPAKVLVSDRIEALADIVEPSRTEQAVLSR